MFRKAVIVLMALGSTAVMAMDQEQAEKVTEVRQAVLDLLVLFQVFRKRCEDARRQRQQRGGQVRE